MIFIPMEKYHKKTEQTSVPALDIAEETKPEGLNESLILQAIPKMYRNKAAAILSHIAYSDILQWNNKGEIIYHGRDIPDSHITDLLRDSQQEHKDPNLIGISEFYQALAELNIPEGLIGHTERRQHVRYTKSHQDHVTKTREKTRSYPYKKKVPVNSNQKVNIFKKWLHL